MADEELSSSEGPAEEPREDRLAAAEARAARTVARYRELLAAGPGLVPEMVRGDTMEELDASVAAARRAYEEIRRSVASEYEREVPAGNPSRSSANAATDGLKPEAKIALGLRRVER